MIRTEVFLGNGFVAEPKALPSRGAVYARSTRCASKSTALITFGALGKRLCGSGTLFSQTCKSRKKLVDFSATGIFRCIHLPVSINKKASLRTGLPAERSTTDFFGVLCLGTLELGTVESTEALGLAAEGVTGESEMSFAAAAAAAAARVTRFGRAVVGLVTFDVEGVEAEECGCGVRGSRVFRAGAMIAELWIAVLRLSGLKKEEVQN